MDWIETIINRYADNAADFLAGLKGAEAEKIKQFEQITGRTFPDQYVDYLLRCGSYDGGILGKLGAHTDIDNLLSAYEELDEFPEDFPSGDWVIIGSGHAGVDIIMNCRTGVIHDNFYDDGGDFFAESIAKLFEQQAFLKFCIMDSEDLLEFSLSAKQIEEELKITDQAGLLAYVSTKFECFASINDQLSDARKIISEGNGFSGYAELTAQNGVMFLVSGASGQEFISELKKDFG